MAAAAAATADLSKELTEKNKIIAEKQIVVTEIIEDVKTKSAAAEKDAADAAVLEDKLSKDAVVIAREEASA